MADIYLDNGELASTMFGDIAIVTNEDDDVLQMAIHSIQTIFGENQFHDSIGNKVFSRRLKVTDLDADIIATDCSNAILQDDRVRSIQDMKIYADDKDKHNLEIEFTIITVYNTIISSMVQIQI